MNTKVDGIYYQFNDRIASYVCKQVQHDDICYDIIQELYLKILEKADNITRAKNAEAYITRMAGNMVIDYYRKKEKPCIGDNCIPAIAAEPIEIVDRQLLLADCCLMPMIQSLPHIYAEALILIELKGMPQKEYAEKMEISLSAAKSRVQRAREKLKEIVLQNNYAFDRYGNSVTCCK